MRKWQASAGESGIKKNANGRLYFRLLQATDIVFHLFKADGKSFVIITEGPTPSSLAGMLHFAD